MLIKNCSYFASTSAVTMTFKCYSCVCWCDMWKTIIDLNWKIDIVLLWHNGLFTKPKQNRRQAKLLKCKKSSRLTRKVRFKHFTAGTPLQRNAVFGNWFVDQLQDFACCLLFLFTNGKTRKSTRKVGKCMIKRIYQCSGANLKRRQTPKADWLLGKIK